MKNKKLNRKKKTPISNNDYISKPLEGDVFLLLQKSINKFIRKQKT
ncbi:hypothetical protein NMD95_02020 [Edwardsiella tarda]